MDMRGKPYLQVAHRILWWREECPTHSVETEFVILNEKEATAKATIKDGAGRVLATSHKTETHKDFPAGHAEKAETGAIGRALALCGYGTQFAPELDEEERIVDSPVTRPKVAVQDFVIPLGTHKGRGLSTLSEAERLELWEKIKAADPNSLPVEVRAQFKKMVSLVGESVGQRIVVK